MYFFRCHEVSGMVKYCWLRPLSAKMIDKYQFGSNRIIMCFADPKIHPKIQPNLPPEICSLAWDDLRVHQLPFKWDSPWVLGIHQAAPNLNFLRVFLAPWHHDLGKSRIFWANKRCLLFFYVPKTFGGTSKLSFWYQFTRSWIHIQKEWWFLSLADFREASWSWTLECSQSIPIWSHDPHLWLIHNRGMDGS